MVLSFAEFVILEIKKSIQHLMIPLPGLRISCIHLYKFCLFTSSIGYPLLFTVSLAPLLKLEVVTIKPNFAL